MSRVLVACVGNVFLGDDGFGVEVAQRLAGAELPAGIEVVDFGIRGLDLTYALLDGYDATILVDATPRGGAPGTLYVLEPEQAAAGGSGPLVDAHDMNPQRVLAMVEAMGGSPGILRVVGCEPGNVAPGEPEMAVGLSEPVRAAVERAARLVRSLATELQEDLHA